MWFAASLVLILGLCWVGWSWRHPAAFHYYGGWAVSHDQWPVGEPLYVGMSYERGDAEGHVSMHAASAEVVRDSAGAEIAFFVCTVNEAAGGAVGAEGALSIRETCKDLRPASESELNLDLTPVDQLVMAVTLTESGRVTVEGVDLSYSHGWRRGTQHVGGEVDVSSAD